MIGSDTWINQRWLYYDELMQGYRAWLGGLPADVARRIAWNNGARLFGLSIPRKQPIASRCIQHHFPSTASMVPHILLEELGISVRTACWWTACARRAEDARPT